MFPLPHKQSPHLMGHMLLILYPEVQVNQEHPKIYFIKESYVKYAKIFDINNQIKKTYHCIFQKQFYLQSPLGPIISTEFECSFSLEAIVSPPIIIIKELTSFSSGHTYNYNCFGKRICKLKCIAHLV